MDRPAAAPHAAPACGSECDSPPVKEVTQAVSRVELDQDEPADEGPAGLQDIDIHSEEFQAGTATHAEVNYDLLS